MNQELALVPQCIIQRGNKIQENILSILLGVLCLSLLAQIAIPLPGPLFRLRDRLLA